MKTAEFKYFLLKLLSLYKQAVHQQSFQAFSQSRRQTSDVTFSGKEKHPFCSQYSLISDVSDDVLMMLRRPKFVRILIDRNRINRTIFND